MSSTNWPIQGSSPYWLNAVANAAALPAAGVTVGEVRLVLDVKDLYEWDGAAWNKIVNSSGTVIGPASVTDNTVALFNGATGKLLKASAVTGTTLAFLDATSSVQTQLNGKQPTGNYITALTGDVSASGAGSDVATVNSVGGSTAANVHAAELIANAALVPTSILAISSNVTLTDKAIHLVDTTSARSLAFPNPATCKLFVVKDKTGTCSTNNITLTQFGSETIENVAGSYVLNSDYGSWTFISDLTNFWLI